MGLKHYKVTVNNGFQRHGIKLFLFCPLDIWRITKWSSLLFLFSTKNVKIDQRLLLKTVFYWTNQRLFRPGYTFSNAGGLLVRAGVSMPTTAILFGFHQIRIHCRIQRVCRLGCVSHRSQFLRKQPHSLRFAGHSGHHLLSHTFTKPQSNPFLPQIEY